MKILAFGHRKRVGKNTLANMVADHLRQIAPAVRVKTAGFADELKLQTHRLYAWAGLQDGAYYETHPEFREVVFSALGKTPRQVWIEYGNKIRDIYPDTWVDFLLKRSDCDVLLITDMRYENEFLKVEAAGGACIKVENFRVVPTWDKADESLRHVPDERWHAIAVNDYGLDKLKDEAVCLVNRFVLR